MLAKTHIQCPIEAQVNDIRRCCVRFPSPYPLGSSNSNTSVVSPSPPRHGARRSLLTLWWRNPSPPPPPSPSLPPFSPSCACPLLRPRPGPSDHPLPVCRERSVNQRTLHLPQLRCLHSTEKRGREISRILVLVPAIVMDCFSLQVANVTSVNLEPLTPSSCFLISRKLAYISSALFLLGS